MIAIYRLFLFDILDGMEIKRRKWKLIVDISNGKIYLTVKYEINIHY